MFAFYIFLLLVITIIILMFFIALKINFVFDTSKENMNLTILWLYPLIKAEVYIKNKKPMLKVFLLKMKIYEKALKTKKGLSDKMTLVKDIKFNNINLTAYYGFRDKFTVGIVCGLIGFVSQFLKIKNLEQSPDFMSNNDYIYINANAAVDIVPTLISLAHH